MCGVLFLWAGAILHVLPKQYVGRCCVISKVGEVNYLNINDCKISPFFVPIHNVSGEYVGFATVYYDNYIICCSDFGIINILYEFEETPSFSTLS